jgi:hypothetical protein
MPDDRGRRPPRGAVPAARAPEPITPLAAIAQKFTIDDIAYAVREGLILYEAAGALFANRADMALFADMRKLVGTEEFAR